MTVRITVLVTLLCVASGCWYRADSERRPSATATVEERTAAVVKAMKQLQVREFEAKTGEEIAQVVARLHELAKPGLPGLPSERSGISILLKSRSQEREQAEVLRKGFRVEDVSFYDVVGAFCAAADYEFNVDGGYLRIAPTGTGFADIDRHEPTDEEH